MALTRHGDKRMTNFGTEIQPYQVQKVVNMVRNFSNLVTAKKGFLMTHLTIFSHLSHRITKPTTCIGENKGADQLCSNRTADQHLCFRYTDSTFPLLNSITCFCDCKGQFVSDLFGNPNCYFLMQRFIAYFLSLKLLSQTSFQIKISKTIEPPHGKTNNLHRRKQRRRSASQ